MKLRAISAAAALLAVAMACSLVLEPGALDEGCSAGSKPCFGKCVSKSDPAYGCGRSGCAPCGLLNASSNCSAELVCGVGSCQKPFDDCDHLAHNGCEVNKDEDTHNCGRCFYDCEQNTGDHVTHIRCGGGNCYIYECAAGYVDLDGDYHNGCEQLASTLADAGT